MYYDIQEMCYRDSHIIWISFVSIPALLLWIIGFPALYLLILLRNKKLVLQLEKHELPSKSDRMTLTDLKTKYGFLINGYKIKTYYWELVIFFRKITLIMVIAYLMPDTAESQVLTALFILVIALLL